MKINIKVSEAHNIVGNRQNIFCNPEYLKAMSVHYLSICMEEGNYLFNKIVTPEAIENNLYDIFPKLGYQNCILNTDNVEFIISALHEYSKICCQEGIIAELIRFDPMNLIVRDRLSVSNTIQMFIERQISYIEIKPSFEEQINYFNPQCKRRVKKGMQYISVKKLMPTLRNIDLFINIYYRSLETVKSEDYWFFEKSIISNLMHLPFVSVWAAGLSDSNIENNASSAALLLEDNNIAYLLLMGNIDAHKYLGINEYLIAEITNYCRIKGFSFLCLGGGRSIDQDDSLFKFKKKNFLMVI